MTKRSSTRVFGVVNALHPTAMDLTGKRFGRLVVVSFNGKHGKNPPRGYWNVRCDCGAEVVIIGNNLVQGNAKSCGCLNKDVVRVLMLKMNTTHGFTKIPEYALWREMHRRCCDPKAISYPHYGAKGVRVCKRWNDFERFLEDMGSRPSKEYSIDRIRNDRGYEPRNCKWSTVTEQNRNHSKVKLNVELVREIRRRSALGQSYQRIADAFGISNSHVWNIVNNRAWKNIEPG